MSLLLPIISIVAGIVLLVVGAESMVRGAASIAKKMSIPEIVVGLTVVALGTSAPEFVVNTFAAAGGQHTIVFGNIIGSNLANILLILGVAGLICPIVVQKSTVWKEIPFLLGITILLFVLVYDSWRGSAGANVLSRVDGIILLVFFLVFMVYTFRLARGEAPEQGEVATYNNWISAGMVVFGLAALFFGGKFTVDGAVRVAEHLGISEKLIACTILAGGTSLPELATSAVAAYRGRSAIAVGNVVGSCILNLVMVLGVSGVICPVAYAALFDIDAIVLVAATLVLFLTMFTGRRHRLDRWEAAIMLSGYFAYVGYQIYCR
ncbi:MAG: calcium/sodium antiporter [Phycisphaerales bacterium]|nr:calcium/sodium antiporter [Phycisphaerales bacterium]